MNRPRIIVFITSYHPFIGGAEIAVEEVTRRLHERFDFFIVTSRVRRSLAKEEKRAEGMVLRYGFGTPFDKWLLPFFALFFLPRRLGLSDSLLWGVDISQGSLSAALIKFFHPRLPFIFTIQYGEGEDRLRRGRFGFLGMAFRFMLSQADGVTAISSYLLDVSRRFGYVGPAEIVHNGVDVGKFVSGVRKKTSSVHDPKVIITVSRLVPKNGIDVLIRAVEEVRKEIPDIRCHILGDGPARETLEMCVSRSRLSPNVKFFGALPHEEIPKYLQEADVFVRPSRSEGMGNSFVEALAVSLPIIGTPVGGILDIIRDGETGLFAAVDNPSDCARKILRLLKDREFGRSIAEKGRKMVGEKFSWDAISKNYEKIFRECHEAHGLRIVMATPLFPPSIGGPATYAKNLAEQFRSLGHRVKILSFGLILSEPILIRHLHYFFRLLRDSRGADIIYALDDFSVGVPAAFVSLLRRIPLAVRWEGDFLWEKFVERTRQEITLPDFYAAAHPLSAKEKIVKKAIGFVLGRASRIGYSSEWRRKIGAGAYGIPPEKLVLVRNVGEENVSVAAGPEREKKILWGGRMLFLKNLSRLIRAFGRANRGDYELWLVGDGPERSRLEALVRERKIPSVRFFPSMDRIRWLHELSRAVCFVLPSFSEVGPTSVTEALSLGVPVIMTRESGYTEILTDGAILVHPFSESEIVQALEEIMEKHSYIRPSAPPFRRGWKETAGEWISLFYESLSHRQRFLHLP